MKSENASHAILDPSNTETAILNYTRSIDGWSYSSFWPV